MTALQTIVSRKVDPIESAVVSICSINCGNFKANNVVQSELTMSGTVRTFLPEIRDLAEENIRAMVTGIATANGCTVELVYDRMIGSVINGEEQTIAAHEVTKALLGEDNVRIIRPRRDHPRGHPRRGAPGVAPQSADGLQRRGPPRRRERRGQHGRQAPRGARRPMRS